MSFLRRRVIVQSLPKWLAGIAIVCVVLAIYGFVDDLVFAQRAIRGTAIVENVSPWRPRKTPSAAVTHEVNGQRVQARIRFYENLGPDAYKPGVEVPILYLPDDPAQARLDVWSARRLPMLTGCVLAVLFGTGAMLLAWRQRRPSGGAEPAEHTTRSAQT